MKNESLHERYGKRAGERIGALTFIGLSTERTDRGRVIGVFSCECGNEIDLPAGRVLNGKKEGCHAVNKY